MKTKLLVLITAISCNIIGLAQNRDMACASTRDCAKKVAVDICKLRVTYRVKISADTIGADIYYDNQALEIGGKLSRYYSLFADEIDSVIFKERLIPSHGDRTISGRTNLQRGEDGVYEDIFINYPVFGSLQVTRRFLQSNFEYTEPLPKIEWQVGLNIDTIMGYTCQSATVEFRGRRWIAWFTTEIPIRMGPYKFSGLPGLILKISDSKNLFVFTAIGISQPVKTPIYRYNISAAKSSRKDVNKMLDLRWKDPVSLYQGNIPVGGDVVVVVDGETVSTPGGYRGKYIPQLELE